MTKDEKKCPLCAEIIKKSAIKCRFCQSDIKVTSESGKERKIQLSSKNDYEIMLLGIPIFSIILIVFWVSNLSLIEGVYDKLTFIFVSTILATAAVIAKEVNDNESKNTTLKSPLFWLVSVALLWLIFYPAYLKSRNLIGLKDRSIFGISLMIIFLGFSYHLFQEIEEKKSEIRQIFEGGKKDIEDAERSLNKTLKEFGYDNQENETSLKLYESDNIKNYNEKKQTWSKTGEVEVMKMCASENEKKFCDCYLHHFKNNFTYSQWRKMLDVNMKNIPLDDDTSRIVVDIEFKCNTGDVYRR